MPSTSILETSETLTIVGDPHDLAFAGRAAMYLEKKGLDHRAVVQCLIDEFELDRGTAEAIASMAA